jgi:hypothetical protein
MPGGIIYEQRLIGSQREAIERDLKDPSVRLGATNLRRDHDLVGDIERYADRCGASRVRAARWQPPPQSFDSR